MSYQIIIFDSFVTEKLFSYQKNIANILYIFSINIVIKHNIAVKTEKSNYQKFLVFHTNVKNVHEKLNVIKIY